MGIYLHPQTSALYALHKAVNLQANKNGTLAQLVEQWTENPCVPGSIPGGTTKKPFTM